MHSGGAPVEISTLDCSGHEVNIESEGGAISINSLDGNANISSSGGNVEVRRPLSMFGGNSSHLSHHCSHHHKQFGDTWGAHKPNKDWLHIRGSKRF